MIFKMTFFDLRSLVQFFENFDVIDAVFKDELIMMNCIKNLSQIVRAHVKNLK